MNVRVAVKVPKLTMAAIDATFTEWLVEDGQFVEENQPLYVVETENVETEVPSPASGVLHYGDAKPQEVYAVGTELAVIEVAD